MRLYSWPRSVHLHRSPLAERLAAHTVVTGPVCSVTETGCHPTLQGRPDLRAWLGNSPRPRSPRGGRTHSRGCRNQAGSGWLPKAVLGPRSQLLLPPQGHEVTRLARRAPGVCTWRSLIYNVTQRQEQQPATLPGQDGGPHRRGGERRGPGRGELGSAWGRSLGTGAWPCAPVEVTVLSPTCVLEPSFSESSSEQASAVL